MNVLKIGLFGLRRGRGLVNTFNAYSDTQVTALCDTDQTKLTEVGDAFQLADNACFTDYESFLGSATDVVIIATPIGYHTEHAVGALESGKHVLCEQTVAYTVEDCQKTVDAVRKSGLTYMMAENYCYFHYVQEWQKTVAGGQNR